MPAPRGSTVAFALAIGCGVCAWSASTSTLAAEPAGNRTGIVCWSDKSGRQIGCGYTVPPEYAGNPVRELNSRGLTVRRTEAAPSPDALRAKQEQDARRKIEAAEQAEQRRRDLALMNSYTSETEIDARRDRDVQQFDLTILGLETHLNQQRASDADIRRRIDAYAKTSRPVPEGLLEDLKRTTSDISSTERLISQKRNEQEAVRVKYNELRNRFIELTRQASGGRQP